jgi:hypothetical protein
MTHPWADYVATRLEADARNLLPRAYRSQVEPDTRPVEPMLARLAPDSALKLSMWDRLARAGAIPDTFYFEEGGQYGFDFVANAVSVFDGDRDIAAQVWMVGHDGGGNGYVVLPTGAVGFWDHETDRLAPDGDFPDLDVFGWAMIQVGAAEVGVLDRDDVLAALAGQGSGGCGFLALRLRELLADDERFG